MLFQWDQTRGFNLCMALFTVPVTLGAVYSAYLVFSEPNLSITALLIRAGLVYLSTSVLKDFADRFRNSGKAKSLGCGPVAVYPHKDPMLGLDLVWQQLRRRKNHTVLEGFIDRFQRYGHTHYELVLGQRIIMTDDAENVKTILATKFEDWPIAGPRLYSVLPLLGPNSIFSSNGEAWHKARTMLRPSFVRDQVADFRCFERHTGNFIQRIPTDGSPVDLQELLLAMSMDSSTDFLLGYSTGLLTENPLPDTREFTRAFTDAALKSSLKAIVGPILFKLPDGSLDRDVEKVRDFVRYYLRKVAAEKAGNKPGDSERAYVFLDELLKQDAPEEYIVDQILSVLIAGRDTTAMGIAACFWFLARRPDVVAKLREEILAMNAQDPTWEQLKNMKFLNSILKESLRLVPPVPNNTRTANKDTVLPVGGGPDGKQPVFVSKGTPVRFSLFSMQRREELYGPSADEFCNARWFDDKFRPGWEYLPFHGGPRVCLGQQFALTQIAFVLYRVFQQFKAIEAADEGPMRLAISITASFANGVPVRMTPA